MKKTNKKQRFVLTVLTILLFSIGFFVYFNQAEIAEATWWNESWNFRKSLTINSSQVVSDLTNFPVLVSLTDTNFSNHAQEDGDDFIFIDKEGKKLSHEIESYASSTGALVAWVKIPSLSSTENTDIYMYYGNQGVSSQQDSENVWDEDYKMVQHYNENSGVLYDSTLNDNDSNSTTGLTYATSTQIGSGLYFDGSGDYATTSDSSDWDIGSGNFTVNFWVKHTDHDGREFYVSHYEDDSNAWFVEHDEASGGLHFGVYSSGYIVSTNYGGEITDTNWHYISLVKEGDDYSVYKDGISVATTTDSSTDDYTGSLFVGVHGQPTFYFDGFMDEIRVSKVNRSENWLQTEYNNQNNPSAFFSASAEEVGPGPVGYWSFDEGYGTVAHDETANKNNGTITGATWKDESECISGKCLYFDGSNDFASIPDSDALDVTSDYTMCVWSKWLDMANNMSIFSKIGAYKFDVDSSSQIRYTTLGQYDYYSGFYPEMNKWHHICVAMDGDYDVSFYVDGNFLTEISYGDSGFTSDDDLIIGLYSSTYFHGFMDEIKIYPYARSADQIKQDYNAGLSGVKSNSGTALSFGSESQNWMSDGLVGYWKFDEIATTSGAIDSSGNGGTGVYNGNASTTAGKFGRAAVFDGSNGVVSVDDALLSDSFPGNSSVAAEAMSFSYFIKYDAGGTTFRVPGRIQMNLGTIFGLVTNEGSGYLTLSGLTSGVWQHVVGTYDGQYMRLYLNGELNGTLAHTGTISPDPDDFYFGASALTGIDGLLDEFRFYNRALTPAEVKKLYEWAPGPVMHLKMDEMSGTSANDSSGTGNNGTVSGATWVQGKYGGGLLFEENADYVEVADDDTLDLQHAITMSAWVKPNAMADLGNNWRYVLSKEDYHLDFGSDDSEWDIVLNQSGMASYYYVPDEKWHFVSATYDGANMKFYWDGILKDTTAYSTLIATNTSNLYIGHLNAGTNYQRFQGVIDEVKIYNYARNQKQIIEDMNGGQSANKAPILHLSFDEGQGETAYDSSIYKNNATLYVGTSGTQTATSSMWDRSGRVKGAVDFDGTDDYVETPSLTMSNTEEFSMAFWIYSASGNEPSGNFPISWDDTKFCRFSGDYLYCTVNGGPTDAAMLDTDISDSSWHHVLFVSDASSQKLYLDGELNATASQTLNTGSDVVTIGAANSHTFEFTGKMDEVKIWNYALSDDEIKEEYNTGSSFVMGGSDTANDNGTTVTGASTEYCVPGDTSECSPPVLELKMDEMSGGTVYDSGGDGVDGSLENGATWTLGKYGTGVRLDGINDTIDTSSGVTLSNNAGTISYWLKDEGTNTVAVAVAYDISVWQELALMYYSSDSGFRFYLDGASYVVLNPIIDVWDGNWHNVSVSWDSSNYAYLYVDGVFQDEESLTVGNPTVTSWRISGNTNDIKGVFDEFRIYDYARTPAQIAWDYNKGKPIAHYKFDECFGSTIHDESGNGNHGALDLGTSGVTATGTCASSSNSFWYNGRSGKKNNAGDFDGTDDIIKISDDSDLKDFAEMTMSAWVYPTGNGQSGSSRILSKTQGASDDDYALEYESDNTFRVRIGTDSGTAYHNSEYVISPNTAWYHVLGVWDGSEVRSYVNGKLEGTATSRSGTLDDTNTELVIGDHLNGADRAFEGKIDDVRIYNYALTEEQIKTVYGDGAVSFK